MKKLQRLTLLILLGAIYLMLTGCDANVGVGVSVGVPVGDHGYISIGGNRWN